MNLKKELMYFLQSLDGDELRNLADGSLPEEMAVDAYIASCPTEKVERFEKVEKKPIDDFFSILDKEEELRTMPKDEYISKARDFIAKVNSMYWSNWSWRTLTDDELPEESQCDNCVEGCVVKLNNVEYDCVPDRMDGVCRIRIFDEGNYADEMSDLMNEFDDIELLDTEIQLTN